MFCRVVSCPVSAAWRKATRRVCCFHRKKVLCSIFTDLAAALRTPTERRPQLTLRRCVKHVSAKNHALGLVSYSASSPPIHYTHERRICHVQARCRWLATSDVSCPLASHFFCCCFLLCLFVLFCVLRRRPATTRTRSSRARHVRGQEG